MSEIIDIDEWKNLSDTELSPYDAEFPIAILARNMREKIEQAQEVAKTVYRAIEKEAPTIFEVADSLKQKTRYVVDMSDEMIKAIDQGKIKLTKTKEGKLCAQILQKNGKYGTKLGIKKESFKSKDLSDVANSLQMAALQNQIEEIASQIMVIDHNIRDVIQGQQNDRIGLYYSGLSLYLESKSISDKSMSQALLVQALRSLTESTFQLSLTLKSDINYLIDKEYNKEKGKKVLLIDERMQSINKSFEFIHRASLLRAAIYCDQGEYKAMTAVLSEYSRFINDSIVNNASLLAQCDVSDHGGCEGIWQKRAMFKIDVTELQKQLNENEQIFYIGYEEDTKEA